ncbi:MAG: GNAT family N-acetyltransferase [Flavobacteriales bacterium]|nr:GNAT family N-acetyltransferase [Flavobacteriales bacterium]
MISLQSQQTLNRIAWDQLIDEALNDSLFGQSWLLDLACKNWQALVLNDYEAALVLPINKKWGIKYAYNPLFIRECGIFSRTPLKRDVLQQFIHAIPRAIFSVDLFLNDSAGSSLFSQRVYQTLVLNQPIEHLRKNYNENTRRNIRKAEKFNVELVFGTNAAEVTSMFLKNKLPEIKELKPADEVMLRQMLQAAIDRNQGFTALVIKEDECLASAGFIHHKDTLLFFKGSVTETGRKIGAMHFLMDQVLEKYTSKFNIFDFGGSNQPEVSRFYKGFGGIDQVYYRYRRNLFGK